MNVKSENHNIIWLSSYPKSGNTWFRLLLTNILSPTDLPVQINELNATLLASNRSLFDKYLGINSSDLTYNEIRDLRPSLYRKISNSTKENVYFKVHDAWEMNTSHEPLFPKDVTKGVIYFIRHPLDVAVSFAFHKGISPQQSLDDLDKSDHAFCNHTNKLHNQLSQNLNTWAYHTSSWIDNSKLPIHIIKYEDMLEDTYAEFSKALDFIGLNYSRAKILSAVNNSQFEIAKKQEDADGFREKPIHVKNFFRSGSSGDWHKYFNYNQIRKFASQNESMMERFGYSLD